MIDILILLISYISLYHFVIGKAVITLYIVTLMSI
jgi:hypothetical protein